MTKAQHTLGLTHLQEREVILAYGLTEGQFYALPVAAQTSLHAAMGKNDSLIAAAPELLDALRLMEDWAATIQDEDSRVPLDVRLKAQAIIAKATGQAA